MIEEKFKLAIEVVTETSEFLRNNKGVSFHSCQNGTSVKETGNTWQEKLVGAYDGLNCITPEKMVEVLNLDPQKPRPCGLTWQ